MAQLTASAVNVGGLWVGALVAGALAQWVADPLTVPYVVFLAVLVLSAIGSLCCRRLERPRNRTRATVHSAYRCRATSAPGTSPQP
jgi:hypothetical protein